MAISLVLLAQAAAAQVRVPANAMRFCASVCQASGRLGISPGTDRSGFPFYVCAGMSQNGEGRPGFNIQTSADSAGLCLLEYGGDRGHSASHCCLCG